MAYVRLFPDRAAGVFITSGLLRLSSRAGIASMADGAQSASRGGVQQPGASAPHRTGQRPS